MVPDRFIDRGMSQVEGLRHYTPEVRIFRTAAEADACVADIIGEQVRKKPRSSLIVPTGSTAIGVYQRIVKDHRAGLIDLSQATLNNLDEYWPMPKRSVNSYDHFMTTHLIDHVPVGGWNIPNGEADDPDEEARDYQQRLSAQQPVALAFVGIGPGQTCHIGFNERGSRMDSTTRYVTLAEETRFANAKLFEDPTQMPEGAITQGMSDVLQAERIILEAKGNTKAWGVARSLKGEISSDAPASFLRLHPNVLFVLDQEAAAAL